MTRKSKSISRQSCYKFVYLILQIHSDSNWCYNRPVLLHIILQIKIEISDTIVSDRDSWWWYSFYHAMLTCLFALHETFSFKNKSWIYLKVKKNVHHTAKRLWPMTRENSVKGTYTNLRKGKVERYPEHY